MKELHSHAILDASDPGTLPLDVYLDAVEVHEKSTLGGKADPQLNEPKPETLNPKP